MYCYVYVSAGFSDFSSYMWRKVVILELRRLQVVFVLECRIILSMAHKIVGHPLSTYRLSQSERRTTESPVLLKKLTNIARCSCCLAAVYNALSICKF